MAKMAMCNMGMGKSMGMNILMLAVYLVAAYILYRVVMYAVNYRPSAMPNVPPSSNNRMGGGCSTGTCGSSK